MADDTFTDAPIEQLRHQVDWNEKFRNGGTTSFAKRKHAQDRAEYLGALDHEREVAQRSLIIRNRDAQNAFFRAKELDLKEQAANQLMEQRALAMSHKEQMFPLQKQLSEAQLDLARTRETIAANAELRRAQAEKRQLEHADALDSHVEELKTRGLLPGTPEFSNGIEEGLRRYPFAPPAMHTDLRAASKVSAENLPATVTSTTITAPSDITGEMETSRRTSVSRKVSPEQLDATTPQTGSDFLKSLGIKPKQ